MLNKSLEYILIFVFGPVVMFLALYTVAYKLMSNEIINRFIMKAVRDIILRTF